MSASMSAFARIDAATREVFLDDDEVVRARTLILATGVTWRRLAIEGFDKLIGKGVYYGASRSEVSATQGLDIHLVGAGNSAGQAALYFANHARKVTILVHGTSLEDVVAQLAPIQPRTLTREWMRVLSSIPLPRIRFHDLRHAHATHLLASGVHPKVASERLGHSRVSITLDLYSHVMPGMQEGAADKIDAALKAAQKRL
jgi:thioredoxin reductase